MQLKEYQEKSKRTMNMDLEKREALSNMIFGITGETGEVVDLFKKHLFQGHDLDIQHLKEELGDVMFYMVNLCNLIGVQMEDIIEGNHNKLLKRYPDGFSEEASIKREDAKEEENIHDR